MFFSSMPSPADSSPSQHLLQSLVRGISSRRLLLHTPFYKHPNAAAAPFPGLGDGQHPADSGMPGGGVDANVVMILAVLLCALICALGLNSIVRCALRCSGRMAFDLADVSAAARLANTGVKRKALRALPTLAYSPGMKLAGATSECTICLSEFAPGDRVRVLPKCNHGFHVRCIDRWLTAHSSCPTCRQCLLGTSQKTSGCAARDSRQPVPVQSILTPLHPERIRGRLNGNLRVHPLSLRRAHISVPFPKDDGRAGLAPNESISPCMVNPTAASCSGKDKSFSRALSSSRRGPEWAPGASFWGSTYLGFHRVPTSVPIHSQIRSPDVFRVQTMSLDEVGPSRPSDYQGKKVGRALHVDAEVPPARPPIESPQWGNTPTLKLEVELNGRTAVGFS
ncbi:hypothetical protein Taro_054578 [Colocasia esculenta]|uniref:RING-type domain-containing protein n=1 Tax=Colocasia esculenta TaxID=4460 RepID=A0A843XNY0_COLES|nr:hypothetical protein [Colocasia esculenta]